MHWTFSYTNFHMECLILSSCQGYEEGIQRGILKRNCGTMVSKSKSFCCSGPLYLTCVNWNNAHHQRSVAASLVQGVYNLERDRQAKRECPKALAPLWWKFFNFHLQDVLKDPADSSIFGAIFKYERPKSSGNYSADGPHFFVAFRGTMFKKRTFCQDMKLNYKLILQKLPSEPRCEIAVKAVQKTVAEAGDSRVWLAGHSLGSAIALVAVKNMATTGSFLRSFLFNPPYPSAPIEEIENKTVKFVFRLSKSIFKAGATLAMEALDLGNQSTDFAALSPCLPQLYVHKDDAICSEYIGYFEQRNKMQEIGAGGIEKLATHQSLCSLLSSAVTGTWANPIHLIPSANLTINSNPSDRRRAHSISQWWQRDLKLESKHYKYS